MRFGVLGCGSIGQTHIRNLKSLDVDVIACDRNKSQLKKVEKTFKVDVTTNYDKILNDENVKAVLICTPTNYHIAPAVKALKKNKHVFIEKPLSNNIKGISELKKIAKSKGKIVYVGFNMRFNPGINKLKDLMKKIGKIYSAKLYFGSYLPERKLAKDKKYDYRMDYAGIKRLGGGVIFDLTHEIDYALYLLGYPSEIFCYADKISNLKIDVEDTAEILLKYKDKIANIHLDFLLTPFDICSAYQVPSVHPVPS